MPYLASKKSFFPFNETTSIWLKVGIQSGMIVWGGQSNMASCCIWVNRSQQSESHIPWSLIVLDYNFFTVSTRWKRTWRVDCSLWWTIKTDLSAFPSLITQVNTQATTERSQPSRWIPTEIEGKTCARQVIIHNTDNTVDNNDNNVDNSDNTVVTILTIHMATLVTSNHIEAWSLFLITQPNTWLTTHYTKAAPCAFHSCDDCDNSCQECHEWQNCRFV